MNEKPIKEIRGAIIWDLLALNATIMLATINTLTYIFTAASVVLLYPLIKDLKRYKLAGGEKRTYSMLLLAGIVSLANLCVLISLIVTRNIYLTYTVYGVGSPVLLAMIVLAVIDAVNSKKQKAEPKVNMEEVRDYTVEEVKKTDDDVVETEETATEVANEQDVNIKTDETTNEIPENEVEEPLNETHIDDKTE